MAQNISTMTQILSINDWTSSNIFTILPEWVKIVQNQQKKNSKIT